MNKNIMSSTLVLLVVIGGIGAEVLPVHNEDDRIPSHLPDHNHQETSRIIDGNANSVISSRVGSPSVGTASTRIQNFF